MSEEVKKTSPIAVALAWAFVGIPSLWAIWQVFQKSLVLFK
jgi:hypothetical protein